MRIRIILSIIFSTFFSHYASYGSSLPTHNDPDRNWRQSLNISYAQYNGQTNVDDWIRSTTVYLTEAYKNEHIQPLIEYNIATNNTATTQFKFLYVTPEDDKLHIATFSSSLNKLFLSGLRCFKEAVPTVLRDKIILSHSFCPDTDLTGQQINAHLKIIVNALIGQDIVKEASHSEALMLLQLNQELPNMLDRLASLHGSNPITILGTVLVISSLKDPCGSSCIPMLKQFNHHIPAILATRVQDCRYRSQIRLNDNLERLILLAGRVDFLGSRNSVSDQVANFNEQIIIDLEHPQARMFSLRFEDL